MLCANCNNLYKSSSITTTATNVVITFTSAPTDVVNEDKFCFAICQDVPSAGNALAVTLTINGESVPLWDRYGNPVPGCGLTKGQIYKGYFGTGTADHVISPTLPNKCACRSYAYDIVEGG
jgi:hypothetical protein